MLGAADEDRVVGIVTERDIVIRVLAEERDPRSMIVRDVATLKPITCAPAESSSLYD